MLIEAAKIVLLGMAIVFVVLSLLGFMLYLIGKITGKLNKGPNVNGLNSVKNETLVINDPTSNSDAKESTDSFEGSLNEDSLNSTDDAFVVAAIAACYYVKNRGYAIKKGPEMSAWLLFGRRALLSNIPPRNPWRR